MCGISRIGTRYTGYVQKPVVLSMMVPSTRILFACLSKKPGRQRITLMQTKINNLHNLDYCGMWVWANQKLQEEHFLQDTGVAY